MKNVLLAGVVLALIGGSVLAQGPGGGRPGFGGGMPGGQGGPGMRGGGGMMGGGMMGGMGGGQRRNPMARIIEELGLTPDQKKKADKVFEDSAAKRKKLDDDTKAAIEKILTPAQKKKMEEEVRLVVPVVFLRLATTKLFSSSSQPIQNTELRRQTS